MATKLIMLFAFFIVIVVIVMFFRPDKKVDPVVKTMATMLTLLLVAMLTVIAYIFMLNFPNSTSVQLKDIICPQIVQFTDEAFNRASTDTTQSCCKDISESYVKSFVELKCLFGSKLKFLVKFYGNTALETSFENLKI